MTRVWQRPGLDQAGIERLAELIALKVARGDALLLRGDLGAGKTTFARALVRALLGDPEADVPSPTFPVLQPYITPRLAVAHFDLYRLSGADDLIEVGFDDALGTSAVIVEWPERAEAAMPADRLEIAIAQGVSVDLRDVVITATGGWEGRLARLEQIDTFLAAAQRDGPPPRSIAYLQGDASARAYARIVSAGESRVLMDAPRMPDGPPLANGLPYSRIAHLAEDVRPFVAIGRALAAAGISAPTIHAADLDRGLLLLEDLGDLTFGRALEAGVPQGVLWSAAVDLLVTLRRTPLPLAMPLPDGSAYRLPRFDRLALETEINLILDWYWPEVKGGPAPASVRAEFAALWSPVLDRLLAEPLGLFLRDYHSPNLFWLPDRPPGARVGVIDFQDALAEPWALDLVSLLQDARIDVPLLLEEAERARYMAEISRLEAGFDREGFLATYAAFGAQRNTRLIGLWVRLLRRDGKPGYLRHMPRTWDYLARNFGHPALSELREWYARAFSDEERRRPIAAS